VNRTTLKRLFYRVPRGVQTPYAPDAAFERFLLQFELIAAFTTARRVLIVGKDAAFGARHLYDSRAASVTGLIASRRVRAFAEKMHALPPHVTYVLECGGDSRRFESGGFAAALQTYDVIVVEGDDPAPAPANMIVRYGNTTHRGHRFTHPLDPSIGVTIATSDPKWSEPRLHIGAGPIALPHWINIDLGAYPEIDFRWDVSRGLPFRDVQYIFAEHFIEHLPYATAARFVRTCREILRDDGVLRMSTPNLDWVWRELYKPHAWQNEVDAHHDCFELNVSFRAWGHQFLYNAAALQALLRNAGFAEIAMQRYGESEVAALRGLEHHERYGEGDVLVVEARGRREPADEGRAFIERYERDVSAL
jgi:predicted SAM-dependent methyltransferase